MVGVFCLPPGHSKTSTEGTALRKWLREWIFAIGELADYNPSSWGRRGFQACPLFSPFSPSCLKVLPVLIAKGRRRWDLVCAQWTAPGTLLGCNWLLDFNKCCVPCPEICLKMSVYIAPSFWALSNPWRVPNQRNYIRIPILSASLAFMYKTEYISMPRHMPFSHCYLWPSSI